MVIPPPENMLRFMSKISKSAGQSPSQPSVMEWVDIRGVKRSFVKPPQQTHIISRNHKGEERFFQIPAGERRFTDIIGVDAAAALFLNMGGAQLHLAIFRKASVNSAASKYITEEQEYALAEEFRSDERPLVRIPLANAFLAHYLASKGIKTEEIARRIRRSNVVVRGYLALPDARMRNLAINVKALKEWAETLEENRASEFECAKVPEERTIRTYRADGE